MVENSFIEHPNILKLSINSFKLDFGTSLTWDLVLVFIYDKNPSSCSRRSHLIAMTGLNKLKIFKVVKSKGEDGGRCGSEIGGFYSTTILPQFFFMN